MPGGYTGNFFVQAHATQGFNRTPEEWAEYRRKLDEETKRPIVDFQPLPLIHYVARDKSDILKYTIVNGSFIGLAGAAMGAQEAYLNFERMPPRVSGNFWLQARILYPLVFRRWGVATGLGCLFCATEALVERAYETHNYRTGWIAAAVTGLAFGGLRPMPQPFMWPLAFCAVTFAADFFAETIPKTLARDPRKQALKKWGTIPTQEFKGDPEPPRPPIMDTAADVRPWTADHYWRGY